MTHTDLINSVLLTLSPLGMAWSNPTGMANVEGRVIRFGKVGSPDVLAIIKGRWVGVECKTGTGRQSPGQLNFQAAASRAGGVYILARSVDDVANRLKLEGLA